MKREHLEEVTLLQAIGDCYNFHPHSHKARIEFEIVFPNEERTIWFGKHWSNVDKCWTYYEGQTNCPTYAHKEKHFLSNLFCGNLNNNLVYSAQQGKFKVYKVKIS